MVAADLRSFSVRPSRRAVRSGLTAALMLVAGGSFGCSSSPFAAGGLFAPADAVADADATPQAQPQGQYLIEVRRGGSDVESNSHPLYGTETVNTALEKAGLTKKKGGWDIELIRTNPQSGMRHKMHVDYDRAERRVRYEQDYALFPNDHLIVKKSEESPLDELFSSF